MSSSNKLVDKAGNAIELGSYVVTYYGRANTLVYGYVSKFTPGSVMVRFVSPHYKIPLAQTRIVKKDTVEYDMLVITNPSDVLREFVDAIKRVK